MSQVINAEDTRYSLVVLPPSGGTINLANAFAEFLWEEPREEYATRLKAAIANVEMGDHLMQDDLVVGTLLRVDADWGQGWKEIQRFTVREWETMPEKGVVAITAYDDLFPLLKSKADYYYPKGTVGKQIIEDMAGQWNIPLGRVEGPNTPLSKQKGTDSIAGLFKKVITETGEKGGGLWIIQASEGLINVIPPGTNEDVYRFTEGENIMAVGERRSIADLVTRVVIIGKSEENTKSPVVATHDKNTEFGIFQEIIQESEAADDGPTAEEKARVILDKRATEKKVRPLQNIPDIPFLRKGHAIRVQSGTLNGVYRVASVAHDASKKSMNVEVEDMDNPEE